MAATALSKTIGRQLDIRLIESDEIGIVGVGEATIPAIRLFNALADINEDEFIRATQATFKMGIQFQNWGRLGETYMHAFGQFGQSLGLLEFFQYWLRAKEEGIGGNFWDYSLNATAAGAGKFSRLPTIPNTRLEGVTYAFHFDAGLYARYLRGVAEAEASGAPKARSYRSGNGRKTDSSSPSRLKAAKSLRANCSSTARASAVC